MDLSKLPRTDSELEEFKKEAAKMPPLELLQMASDIMSGVKTMLDESLPLSPPSVDTSRWTLEQKLEAGGKMASDLGKLARNIPELRRLDILDVRSEEDSASSRLASQVIQHAKRPSTT